jgi:multiple sugar transport system ATP-binding protein
MAGVTLRALEKSYGALRIVKGIDLEIRDREFVVLVGPSGCARSSARKVLKPVAIGGRKPAFKIGTTSCLR